MPDEVLTNVLLESGTNELEVMEFKIADRSFGINVAKVMEILRYTEVTPMPNSSRFVEGIFKPRNTIMTVIDLATYLNLEPSKPDNKDIFIITKFNGVSTAFHVHAVEGIHRISWSDIEKPDKSIYGSSDSIATGIARYKDRLITIVDFEKILTEINPDTVMDISKTDSKGRSQNIHPIIIVEDSPILMRMIEDSLNKMGYSNIVKCNNGQEAMDLLNEFKEKGGSIFDHVAAIITDIEMPKIDGHRLIKLIRSDIDLRELPVIIFSSLISDEMRIKGDEVGATAQVSKPEIANLIHILDKYVHQYN